jgi:ribosomal protein L37AE/L43A
MEPSERIWPAPETQLIGLARAANVVTNRAFDLLVCPDCKAHRRQLIFGKRWQCTACAGYPYRTQAVGSKVAAWEKRVALERGLRRGRPKGMHNATYQAKLRELAELQRRLGGRRVSASAEHQLLLRATWEVVRADERRPEPAAPPALAAAPPREIKYDFSSLNSPDMLRDIAAFDE